MKWPSRRQRLEQQQQQWLDSLVAAEWKAAFTLEDAKYLPKKYGPRGWFSTTPNRYKSTPLLDSVSRRVTLGGMRKQTKKKTDRTMVSLRLSKAMLKELTRRAAAAGMTRSDLMRLMLERALGRVE